MTTENIGEIVNCPSRARSDYRYRRELKWKVFTPFKIKMLRIVSAKTSLGRGVYLRTEEDGTVNADIYVSLQYGVNVPGRFSIEIAKRLLKQGL